MPPPAASFSLPETRWFSRLRRCLIRWFDRAARDLPWRRTSDPYAIWISEVMLQQTQVATVVTYFERFLATFPTIAALAAADRQDVLRAWEGLGYYRRAVQLHLAAKVIVERHGGALPRDRAVLARLPGVGPYTAGAVLSIAFDRREPILESNTLRLWCRLLAWPTDPRTTAAKRLFLEAAQRALPVKAAGRMNQALMELGACVCAARRPKCGECPVAKLCRARAMGLADSLPRTRPTNPPTPLAEIAVALRRRGRCLLWRRSDGGRWAGLWDFPCLEVLEPDALIVAGLAVRIGATLAPPVRLGTIRYPVTRYRVTRECFAADVLDLTDDYRQRLAQILGGGPRDGRWLAPTELERYPLSAAGRRMARMLG